MISSGGNYFRINSVQVESLIDFVFPVLRLMIYSILAYHPKYYLLIAHFIMPMWDLS